MSATWRLTPSSTPPFICPSRLYACIERQLTHVLFQNPKNTPVTLTMKNAELNNIHVAQNVPQRSPMTVTIDGAKTNQIVISQSAPMSSPLTWKLVGDPGDVQY